MELTIRRICELTDGTLLEGDPDVIIRHVTYDSRDMQGDDLFVPLRGARVDAHNFIGNACENGAVATLSEREDLRAGGRPVIHVTDSLTALQQLGRYYRSLYRGRVVAVTGSVGKTTTRELTKAALSAGGSVAGSTKNLNSVIGMPVVLCHMDQTADRAVLEAGISEPDEMIPLADMIRPVTAIVTNIGVAHIEYLGSREGICREKMHITDGLGTDGCAVLNGDEPLLRAYEGKLPCRVLYFGLGHDNDLYAEDIRESDTVSFTAVERLSDGSLHRFPVTLLIPGVHNVMNALAALGAAKAEGIDLEAAAEAMGRYGGFSRRLERLSIGGLKLIDDSYNASPPSMKAALGVLEKASGRKKIAVLADMLELGPDERQLHREVGEFAAHCDIDSFITLGRLVSFLEEPLRAAGKPVFHADDWETAEAEVVRQAEAGDVLLLKGSNIMNLDKLLEKLKNEKKFID